VAKRRNNEGTIKKRADGRWEVQLMLPDGRHKSFYAKAEKEALQKMRQTQRDIEDGVSIVEDKQTVAQYLSSGLDAVQLQLKPASHRRYRDMVNLHIDPSFGTVQLAKLTPQRVQLLYTA
jgi:integrase